MNTKDHAPFPVEEFQAGSVARQRGWKGTLVNFPLSSLRRACNRERKKPDSRGFLVLCAKCDM